MCVRRAAGYCCIQYTVCADQTNAFSLDGGTAISAIDTACTLDYIAIPGETSLKHYKLSRGEICVANFIPPCENKLSYTEFISP